MLLCKIKMKLSFFILYIVYVCSAIHKSKLFVTWNGKRGTHIEWNREKG